MKARATRIWLTLLVFAGTASSAALAACGTGTPAPTSECPVPASYSCPAAPASPPSWQKDVQPIVQAYCGPCHLPGGVETMVSPPLDYSTYAGFHGAATRLPGVLLNCTMPPPDAGALPLADKQTLLEWAYCGAPNN